MGKPDAFLERDFARFYDWSVQDRDEDQKFYATLAEGQGRPVLELACGTGRLLLPLARDGFSITGLDLSTEMLRIARAKVAKEPKTVGKKVRLVLGDMSDFHLGEKFRLIMVAFSSFFHLRTRVQQLGCLHCMHQHLTPRGTAVVDVLAPELMRHQKAGEAKEIRSGVNPDTGKLTKELNRKLAVDRTRQTVKIEHTYIEGDEGDRQEQHRFVQSYRWVEEDELLKLFVDAGFSDVVAFGEYDWHPYASTSDRLIVVARV